MKKRPKPFAIGLVLLAMFYPAYIVFDVLSRGELGEHCLKVGRLSNPGAFCRWGSGLGERLFGDGGGHLGYALLVGVTALAFAAFALWVLRGDTDGESTRSESDNR